MSNKMKTKKELVKDISDETGLTQLKTKEVVQRLFDKIIHTLVVSDKHRIELRNFGVFEVKQRKPRKARNPRTGETVFVPAKNVVTFKPGKHMEDMIKNLENVPAMKHDEEDSDAEAVINGKHPKKKPSKLRTSESLAEASMTEG